MVESSRRASDFGLEGKHVFVRGVGRVRDTVSVSLCVNIHVQLACIYDACLVTCSVEYLVCVYGNNILVCF